MIGDKSVRNSTLSVECREHCVWSPGSLTGNLIKLLKGASVSSFIHQLFIGHLVMCQVLFLGHIK